MDHYHHHGGAGYCGDAIPIRRDMNKASHPKNLNEMEAELHSLHKENFDLKMTIYYQKDMMARLKGGELDLDDRQRELEEQLADLEYRMQEKDARIEELEQYFLQQQQEQQYQQQLQQQQQQQQQQQYTQHQQQPHDLKDDMRQVSREQAAAAVAAAAEREALFLREKAQFEERMHEMELLLERERGEKDSAMEACRHAHAETTSLQNKVRDLEGLRGMLQREMELKLQEAQRTLEDVQTRHARELSQAKEKEAAAAASMMAATQQQHQQQQQLATLTLQQQQQQQQQQRHQQQQEEEERLAEYRLRAVNAEGRVRDLEIKLNVYQKELQEVSQLKNGDASFWKDSLETMRRELKDERDNKEKAIRDLKHELEEALHENAKWRQGSRGTSHENQHLLNQLAAEKRAKDALLLDMSDIRRHSKVQLKDLLTELQQFDRLVDVNFAELFEHAVTAAEEQEVPINTPLKALLAAEEDVGRRRGLLSLGGLFDPSPTKQLTMVREEERVLGVSGGVGAASINMSTQASGKLMVRQAQDLVRKWRLKLQVLPSLNARFRDVLTQTGHIFERRLLEMTERVAEQERCVQEAQRKIDQLRAGKREGEVEHGREVEKVKRGVQQQYQEMLTQLAGEKKALAEAVAKAEKEVGVWKEKLVGKEEEMGTLRRHHQEDQAAIATLQEEVGAWHKRCEAEGAKLVQVVKEKEVLAGEKRRLQVEMDRLLHQLMYRDDVISVFKETLEGHGLDKLPHICAQLALLERQMAKKGATIMMDAASSSMGAAAGGGGGGGDGGDNGRRLTELVRQGLEEAAAQLMTSGGGGNINNGLLEQQQELLLKHAEELRLYGREVHVLVAATKEMLERFAQLRANGGNGGMMMSGGGVGGLRALEEDVGKLLEENARVSHFFRGLHLDLQRLLHRALPSSSSMHVMSHSNNDRYSSSPLRQTSTGSTAAAAGGGYASSPYASPGQQERRRRAAGLHHSGGGGSSSREILASLNNHSNASYLSPMPNRSRAAEELLLRSTSSSFGGGGVGMQRPRAAAAGTGGGRGMHNSGGGGQGHMSLSRHHLQHSTKPIANLEKISHDLQEIAHKLEQYKGVGSGGVGDGGSSNSSSNVLPAAGASSSSSSREGTNTILPRLN